MKGLPKRFEEEARTLAKLTGWKIEDIRERQDKCVEPPRKGDK